MQIRARNDSLRFLDILLDTWIINLSGTKIPFLILSRKKSNTQICRKNWKL